MDGPLAVGVAHFINFELKRCQELFEAHLREPDAAARASRSRLLLHRADPLVCRALITERSDHFGEAAAAVKEAEDAAAAERPRAGFAAWLLGSGRGDGGQDAPALDTTVVTAHLYLWQACLLLRQGSYVKGGLRLRAAWKCFEALLALPELEAACSPATLSDVYFGAGAYLFFVSIVPPAFQGVLALVGFSADRERGRALLERAVALRGPRSPVAAVILLWVQSAFYEDRVAAEAIYARAAAEFPRGVFFHYMAGYLARKDGRVEEALRRFEHAMDSSTEVRELQLACVYERGWCYFVLNDFEHAVPLLERFLAEFRSPSFRAFAAFQLGYALDALGRIDDARAAMARVEGFVRRHFSFDQYARRKAREYLASARGLSDAERRLVCAANCVEALRWDAALALLREMERAGDVAEPAADADLRALWHYTLARALRGRRAAHAEIETQLQRVDALARQVRRETFVVSHALCEQGELRLEQGALAEAEALFQRARSALAECDFDKPLLRRLQLNLDTLAAARARRPRADSE